MKYLITGGAGFIGTNLTERLLADGHAVVIVDDLSGGKRERVPDAAVFYQFDICETDRLRECMEGVDAVVHLAALPRVQFSIDHPFEAQRANVDGTLSVLEAARAAGVRRVVYAASSSAYGDQTTMPLVETMTPQPKSPYGLQKFYGEELLKMWHMLHGLETVSLRFFNVYGPHLDPDGPYALVVGKFLKQRKNNEPLTICGTGENTRDFTHVRDVVEAVVRASQAPNVGRGEVFNVGAGRGVSVNALANMIGGDVVHIEPRIEPMHTLADTTAIKNTLGWQPTIMLEEGIAELKQQFGIV